MRLEECTLKAKGKGAATLVDIDGSGTFYTDDATLEVTSPGGATRRLLQTLQTLDDVPATVTFLSGDSVIISDAREV